MTVVADSSFIYALVNEKDPYHRRAITFASSNRATTILPDIILPEVSYLFLRDFGYVGVQLFLERILEFDIPLEPLVRQDLVRMREIAIAYSSAEFDIVDCCIMAIAERLGINRIATFDRRDFSIFRPKHCRFFELLPSV